ncbi:MAG TPA: hypothetical protein VGI96_29655 [Streptosporangiaceae bacterium]
MPTVHQTPDTDPLPPPGTTPYFRRLHAAVEEAATWYDGGLTPVPWAA